MKWISFKKIRACNAGFSLTEVMIGIMILTVAIVSATNLLVSLIHTNENNVKTLQAYYLAVEGIEAVRNIRDTNWILNENWLSDESGAPWGEKFFDNKEFSIVLREVISAVGSNLGTLTELTAFAPWAVSSSVQEVKFVDGEASGFTRKVEILPYVCGEGLCEDYKLVRVTVFWQEASKEVVLEDILTDWKGGAL